MHYVYSFLEHVICRYIDVVVTVTDTIYFTLNEQPVMIMRSKYEHAVSQNTN